MEQNKNISGGLGQAAHILRERAKDLGQIVSSKDGDTVKRIMEQDAGRLKEAMQTGDMSALKQTFDNLMRTEEGARLIGKIKQITTDQK